MRRSYGEQYKENDPVVENIQTPVQVQANNTPEAISNKDKALKIIGFIVGAAIVVSVYKWMASPNKWGTVETTINSDSSYVSQIETSNNASAQNTLASMTPEEIVNECDYIINNIPKNGQTEEEWQTSVHQNNGAFGTTYGNVQYISNNCSSQGGVMMFCLENFGTFEHYIDGTSSFISQTTDESGLNQLNQVVRITLIITDYDTAIKTYDLLCEYFNNHSEIDDWVDQRSGDFYVIEEMDHANWSYAANNRASFLSMRWVNQDTYYGASSHYSYNKCNSSFIVNNGRSGYSMHWGIDGYCIEINWSQRDGTII